MKLTKAGCFAVWLWGAGLVSGQAGQGVPPPAPELKKLEFFAGTWHTEGEMKPGPMGPGGKYSSTDVFKWLPGNYFLIANSTFKSPVADGTELMVFGYDPVQKVYTYSSFSTGGERESAQGRLEGDTFTWSSMDGPFKWRYIEKLTAPAAYTIHFEISQDGTNWSTLLEGKSTKQ